MRACCSFCFLLMALGAGSVLADEPDRRTTRVASGPVRAVADEDPPAAPLTSRPVLPPPGDRLDPARPSLLEPTFQLEGVGRGAVACFQIDAEQAVAWELVVREVDGPVAQIFAGDGPPPGRIPWDGRLLDGGLAWCGMRYTYDVASVDSSGATTHLQGSVFTLPAYSHTDRQGISFLLPGQRLASGRHGDPLTAARVGLASASAQLNRLGGVGAVRVEVLARNEAEALALGETIRRALAELLDPGDRPVDLYVGTATSAPAGGTVLITTVPLAVPTG